MSKEDLVLLTSPTPPHFEVMDYIKQVVEIGYQNSYDFNMDSLLSDLPKDMKKFHNDIIGKAILSHNYGEILAKSFREWVRSQLDPADELPCGGASIMDEPDALEAFLAEEVA